MQRLIKSCCQAGMKKILFGVLLLTIFSCTKENNELESDLMFHSVSLASDDAADNHIEAAVAVVGPNLCYKLTHFEVSNTRQNQFDVYAKGIVPEPHQICAQAVYKKDTTVSIMKPAPGTYTINFWNPKNQLFKSETVTVN